MYTLRYRALLGKKGCRYCHTENFKDEWTHYKTCKKMPGEMYERCEKGLVEEEEIAHSIWKAFIERRIEPSFLTNRSNFYCKYCNKRRKNAVHLIKCRRAPECLRQVVKKIYYWKEG